MTLNILSIFFLPTLFLKSKYTVGKKHLNKSVFCFTSFFCCWFCYIVKSNNWRYLHKNIILTKKLLICLYLIFNSKKFIFIIYQNDIENLMTLLHFHFVWFFVCYLISLKLLLLHIKILRPINAWSST